MNYNLPQLMKVSSDNASFIGKRFTLPNSLYEPAVVTIDTFDVGNPEY